MDEELRVWLKTFDARLLNLEDSMKKINHEVGELCGKLAASSNATINPTVKLVINKIVFPLILILGSLWGINQALLNLGG